MTSAHVQFEEDDLRPVVSESGGVYPLRARSHTGVGSIRTLSVRRTKTKDSTNELEKNDLDDGEFHTKQVFSGWKLLWLAYQSTGVVYGDIGTSPLYVYSSTFTSDPSHKDLLGVLSLIIWTLFLIVSVKYVLIVLYADDEGEGGTFALFSLLSRYANIVRRDPREESKVKMRRAATMELDRPARETRNFMERSRFMKWLLRSIGVFGVSLIMSDGVLTPAQSVLGAIQGIEVVSPDISTATIVGVSCGIIVLLFLVQPLGTTKLASSFAPIVIIWLLFNLTFGIYNLVIYDATVLKAFSPYYAGSYLVRNGTNGWKSLGGVLLAFTGCEALFADLGAFTRRAIQLSWLGFVFPCLLLSYIGQAAYIAKKPAAWSNPFFHSVPPGMLYPSLIVAILAAIVASQAIITAVFQLLSQIMTLSYFPQIKLVHTSKIFYGQIYIPVANWLLMIGTIIITAVYNNTTRLGHAYGVCVVLVTFITTNMVALVALIVWKVPSFVVIPVWLIFACLDGVFLSSALTKVPDGAWFTLVLATALSSIFMLWHFGKEQQWHAEAADRFPPNHILTTSAKPAVHADEDDHEERRSLRLTPAFGGHRITHVDGVGIYFDKSGSSHTTPTVFVHFLQKFHASHEVVIFFHLRPLQRPTVPVEERYHVTRCMVSDDSSSSSSSSSPPPSSPTRRGPPQTLPNCFRVTIRHGYTDQVISHDLSQLLYEQVRDFVIREAALNLHRRPPPPPTDRDENEDDDISSPTNQTAALLSTLHAAYTRQTVYVVGKEQLRVRTSSTSWLRRLLLTAFLFMRDSTRSKVQALDVEVDKLVEVGFVKEF